MNVFDIIAITIIGFLAIKGLLRGLIAEVLGVASVILSVVIAVIFVEPFSKFLIQSANFIPKVFVPIVAFLVLLFGTYIIGILIIKFLTHMAESMALGLPNRILGSFVGLFKGVIIVSLIVFIFSFILPRKAYNRFVHQSMVVRFCEPILPETYRFIKNKEFPLKSPDNIRKWLRGIKGVQKKVINEETKAIKEKVSKELKKHE